jgi:hypothetical protein
MKPALVAGAILGVLLVSWTVVMAATGWYRDPSLRAMFAVAIAIQAAVVLWTILRTREGRSYGARVRVGLVTSAAAAVITYVGTVLVTGLAFPGYHERLLTAQEQALRESGTPEEELADKMEVIGASQSPGGQAFAAFMGTLGVGLAASLLAAAVIRPRRAAT